MSASDKLSSRKLAKPRKAPVVKFRPAGNVTRPVSSNAKPTAAATESSTSTELARTKKMLKGVEEAISTLAGLRAALLFDLDRLERNG